MVFADAAYNAQSFVHNCSRIYTGSYAAQDLLPCKFKMNLVQICDGCKVTFQLLLHMLLEA